MKPLYKHELCGSRVALLLVEKTKTIYLKGIWNPFV